MPAKMRTRRQKAVLEKEGILLTPPQQLETITRTRRTTRSITTARDESSEPETAPTIKSVSGTTPSGRVAKRIQAPATTKPKTQKENAARKCSPTLEDSASQSEASVQDGAASDASSQPVVYENEMDEDAEDTETTPRPREAPYILEPPVVAQPVQVPRHMNFRSASQKAPITPDVVPLTESQSASSPLSSPATVIARSPVPAQPTSSNSTSPNRPLSAIATLFKEVTEGIEQEYSPECPSISLHASPTDRLTAKAVEKTSVHIASTDPKLLSPNNSGTPAEDDTHVATPPSEVAVSSSSEDTSSAPKQSSNPLTMSSEKFPDPSKFVYNFPQPGEQKLHTIVNFCLDIKLVEQLRKTDPSGLTALNVAIPSSMLPDLLNFIANHPDASKSALQNLTSANPVAKFVTSQLTKDAMAGTNRPRRDFPANRNGAQPDLFEHAFSSYSPIGLKHAKATHTLRDNFCAAKARELRDREALKEMNAQARGAARLSSSEKSTARTKIVPQWYDEEGNLKLNVFKEVPIEPAKGDSSDEEMTEDDTETSERMDETQDQRDENAAEGGRSEAQVVPETPRNRGWGFGSLLPSAARSVSRLIPGFRRHAVSTQHQNTQPQLAATTEPRPHVSVTHGSSAAVNAARGSGSRQGVGRKMLLTKGQAEARQKAKKEKKWYEEQLEEMRQENARKEETIKEYQIKAMKAARGGTETNPWGFRRPGEKKRKRAPSPDSIPNPKGCSYGMDLDYFGWVSDDEEPASTVSHPPSSKRKRVSTSSHDAFIDPFNANRHVQLPGDSSSSELIGDPLRGRPYTGTMFAIKNTPTQGQADNFDERTAAERVTSADKTPTAQCNTFRVPSPGDSDSDEFEYDESYVGNATPMNAASVAPSQAPSQSPTSTSSPQKSQASSPAKLPKTPQAMAPPPRPAPQPVVLPSMSTPSASEISLNIQRERALKYAAKTPSRLQQSSRLSTSTIASDVQEDEDGAGGSEKAEKSSSTNEPQVMSQVTEKEYFDSYYKYQESLPEPVIAHIERSWEYADSEFAVKSFEEEFEAFMKQEQALATSSSSGQQQQQTNTMISQATPEPTNGVSARVQAFLDSNWTDADTNIAGETFASEVAAFEVSLTTGAEPALSA